MPICCPCGVSTSPCSMLALSAASTTPSAIFTPTQMVIGLVSSPAHLSAPLRNFRRRAGKSAATSWEGAEPLLFAVFAAALPLLVALAVVEVAATGRLWHRAGG